MKQSINIIHMNKASKLPKAYIGHIVDLYRIARWTFHNPHSYTKYRAINNLRKVTEAKTFIETGTFRGLTAKRCARVFDQVLTIELDDKLYAEASDYLAPLPNVKVIHGDGLVEVEKLLSDSSVDNVVLFLDGHFSGGVTALGDMHEPAVEELAVLSQYRDKISGIIIDDFREFGTMEGWPKKWELIRAAEELFVNDGYDLAVYLDQVIISRRM